MSHIPDSVASLLPALRAASRGGAVTPGSDRFDQARALYFSGLLRSPGAIVRPRTASEVASVLSVVREAGVPLAVRSGGHSPAGWGGCDGGVVLDLRALRGIEIDPSAGLARAAGGVTAGEYTRAAGSYGLATGFGDAPTVGIGGITLGGGVGFLHRKFGLSLDALVGAEVVTAEGEVLEVNEVCHPDLFWALKGGGGNFGVVTRFDLQLHPVREILGGMLILPATPALVGRFVELLRAAPDEVSGLASLLIAPPMPMIPPEHHGRLVIAATLVHAGGGVEAERALAPFRRMATPLMDGIAPTQYGEVFAGAEGHPAPTAMATRSGFLDQFGDAEIEAACEALERGTAPMRMLQIRILGGAVARVPDASTAFAHRSRAMMIVAVASYEDPAEAHEHDAWAVRLRDALGAVGAYVGFAAEGEDVDRAYPGGTGKRLSRIKGRFDPGNLFRGNLNLVPEVG